MAEDEYARERENLIESDPIALVDELLELRRIVAGVTYEYRIKRRWRDEEYFHELGPWYSNLAQAQDVLRRNVDLNIHHKTGTEFKLVKRIAHGPVIDA